MCIYVMKPIRPQHFLNNGKNKFYLLIKTFSGKIKTKQNKTKTNKKQEKLTKTKRNETKENKQKKTLKQQQRKC